MNYLFKALVAKLEGEIEVAKANAMVYQKNASGIGEHPDIVEAIESQVAKVAEAQIRLILLVNILIYENVMKKS